MFEKILDVIRETPLLKRIFEILENGKFTEIKEPVADDENIIGEMSPLEKACSTFVQELEERVLKELEDFRISCSFSFLSHPPNLEEMVKKFKDSGLMNFLAISKKTGEVINDLKWVLIRDRLKCGEGSLGVRKGFKIVLKKEEKKEECNCFFCQAKRLGIGGIAIKISGQEHESLEKKNLN
jgi:hypothetical protein